MGCARQRARDPRPRADHTPSQKHISMGACLSCLNFGGEDDELNERSTLLDGQHVYSDENLHDELIKQQQRQSELAVIVNNLNDKLLDISTFLGPRAGHGAPIASLNSIEESTNDNFRNVTPGQSPSVAPAGLDVPNLLFPSLVLYEEKQRINAEANELLAKGYKVYVKAPDHPLYVQL